MYIIDTTTGESVFDSSYASEWLAIPADLTLPAPLKKLAKEYETAWNTWSEESASLETVTTELGTADAADTLALIDAVSNGEPNPGHPNREAATEKYRYQAEVTRQAAGRANQLQDKVRASLIEHKTALITDAAQLERDAITRSANLYADARNTADKAEREALTIGSRINWITTLTDAPTDVHRHVQAYIPVINWMDQYKEQQPNALAVLDAITGEPTGWQISNLEQESEDA